MRRLWAVGAAMVLCLAVSGAPVAGQSREPLDPMGASYWTGTWSFISGDPFVWNQTNSMTAEAATVETLVVVEASDPRILGEWTQILNMRGHEARNGREWNILTGEGAYEGLTADFRFVGEGSALEGVIVPSDMPPLPEAVEPPAE